MIFGNLHGSRPGDVKLGVSDPETLENLDILEIQEKLNYHKRDLKGETPPFYFIFFCKKLNDRTDIALKTANQKIDKILVIGNL